jgi:hypothetical protein
MFSNDPLRTEFFATNQVGIDRRAHPGIAAARAAVALYNRSCSRARWKRMLSMLAGRDCSLLSLAEIEQQCLIHNRHALGVRSVPIRWICGSEQRCGDFDVAFRPCNPSCRARWLNIAVARQLGVALPPVDLIRVEQVYFVRDGHHRVSVARAMGQEEIDAEVTSWHVEFPESWIQSGTDGFPRRPDGRSRQNRESAKNGRHATDGNSRHWYNTWSADQAQDWTPRQAGTHLAARCIWPRLGP